MRFSTTAGFRARSPGPPAAAGVSGLPAGPEEQHGTRQRVARSILDHGPSTAAELAARLELTQAAVRRHLDALVAEGIAEPTARGRLELHAKGTHRRRPGPGALWGPPAS
jgi:DNA-binding transcriptional ArsR family regulator